MQFPQSFVYVLVAAALLLPGQAQAEQAQEWEVLRPDSIVYKPIFNPAPRLKELDGKTIVLRWNSKPNGDALLDYVAERIAQKAPHTKIIKSYREVPSLNAISTSFEFAEKQAKAVLALKPDFVLAAPAD